MKKRNYKHRRLSKAHFVRIVIRRISEDIFVGHIDVYVDVVDHINVEKDVNIDVVMSLTTLIFMLMSLTPLRLILMSLTTLMLMLLLMSLTTLMLMWLTILMLLLLLLTTLMGSIGHWRFIYDPSQNWGLVSSQFYGKFAFYLLGFSLHGHCQQYQSGYQAYTYLYSLFGLRRIIGLECKQI